MNEQDSKPIDEQEGRPAEVPADAGKTCDEEYVCDAGALVASYAYDARDRIRWVMDLSGETTTYEIWRDPDSGNDRVPATADVPAEARAPAQSSAADEERPADPGPLARLVAFLRALHVLRRHARHPGAPGP